MQTREYTEQENFHRKLKVLGAICSVRPHENNAHLAVNPVVIGSFLLDWHPSNTIPIPTLEQVNAVTLNQVITLEDAERKKDRDNIAKKDMALKAAFRIEKKANPALKFSDYMDLLENEIV